MRETIILGVLSYEDGIFDRGYSCIDEYSWGYGDDYGVYLML